MSELKLVTRNIRINGIQHKASDMSEEEIKCLLIQRQDCRICSLTFHIRRNAPDGNPRRPDKNQEPVFLKSFLVTGSRTGSQIPGRHPRS